MDKPMTRSQKIWRVIITAMALFFAGAWIYWILLQIG